VLGGHDLEERLALGERLLVHQHLLGASAPWAACVDGVLRPDFEARVVFERSIGRRDSGVVLLDAALHLLEHLRLQGFGARQHGLGVGVLCR
jgi:hypothetical protein